MSWCELDLTFDLAVVTRAVNEYSSLGVRGGLGLYSSLF